MKVSYELTDMQKHIILLVGREEEMGLGAISILLKSFPESLFPKVVSLPNDVYEFIKNEVFNENDLEEKLFVLGERDITKLGCSSFLDIYLRRCKTGRFKADEKDEVEKEIEILQFLNIVSYKSEVVPPRLQLTEYGHRINKLLRDGRRIGPILPPSPTRVCFIAMAFEREETDYLFENVMKPACDRLDCECVRIDIKEPDYTISDAILKAVDSATIVMADLTFARPSVYFETGFAHGRGISLLLTCRRDHYRSVIDEARVHFDLEQYKISFWEMTKSGTFIWQKGMDPYCRLQALFSP